MADPVARIAEMARGTRAGGVVAACVWDMKNPTLRGPVDFTAEQRAPELAPDVCQFVLVVDGATGLGISAKQICVPKQ